MQTFFDSYRPRQVSKRLSFNLNKLKVEKSSNYAEEKNRVRHNSHLHTPRKVNDFDPQFGIKKNDKRDVIKKRSMSTTNL